ncbi:MAG: hypothetical protein SV862_04190 [Pseudomonadota bacterium]|nr:hypothetical protein [Pseudomonadota bacterium]
MQELQSITCRCRAARLTISGPSIMSSECMCTSCRLASEFFAALPDGVGVTDGKGATHVIIHRADKIACDAGAERLQQHRLTPDSPTRRIFADCCNTPMFLDFEPGHWVSLYAKNLPETARPAVEYRMFCSDLVDADRLPSDVPNGRPIPLGAAWRLASSFALMGFRSPTVPFLQRASNV